MKRNTLVMSKFKRYYLNIFIFFTGMVVLVIELTGSRLLAPYFGNGIFVWSNIITVVLFALAVGYWAGGWLADRRPNYDWLMWLPILAGIVVSFTPLLFRTALIPAVERFTFYNNSVVILSLCAALILFFVPTCLLGMVSPFANRLACHDPSNIGRATGRLYAWSTVGSIAGSLFTTFIAVPNIGTRETLFMAATLLIVLGLIGLGRWRYLPLILIPAIFYFGARSNNTENNKYSIRPRPGIVYETESPYQFIQIYDDARGRNLITDAGFGLQSMMSKKSLWTNSIYDTFTMLPAMMKPAGEKMSVLFLGLAGGTIGRQMNLLYATDYQLRMTGVDIDQAIVKAGIEYLNMPAQNMDIHYMDARQFLQSTNQKFDLIILDVFAQQYDIPFHLMTQEFFYSVDEQLEFDGIFSVNIVSVNQNSPLIELVARTIGSVFTNVKITTMPDSHNFIFIAGHDTMSLHPDWLDIRKYPKNSLATINLLKPITPTKGKIFTDNWAPVEYLTENDYLAAKL